MPPTAAARWRCHRPPRAAAAAFPSNSPSQLNLQIRADPRRPGQLRSGVPLALRPALAGGLPFARVSDGLVRTGSIPGLSSLCGLGLPPTRVEGAAPPLPPGQVHPGQRPGGRSRPGRFTGRKLLLYDDRQGWHMTPNTDSYAPWKARTRAAPTACPGQEAPVLMDSSRHPIRMSRRTLRIVTTGRKSGAQGGRNAVGAEIRLRHHGKMLTRLLSWQ